MNNKILIVDDNKEISEMLSRAFKGIDLDSIVCRSAEEAFAILEKDNINVIIADLWMPGLDGIELLRQIKKNNHYTIVFCMVGDLSKHSMLECLEHGASDFFAKASLDIEYILYSVKAAFSKLEHWRNVFYHFSKNKKLDSDRGTDLMKKENTHDILSGNE